jgi:hypothetical protein
MLGLHQSNLTSVGGASCIAALQATGFLLIADWDARPGLAMASALGRCMRFSVPNRVPNSCICDNSVIAMTGEPRVLATRPPIGHFY